MERSPIYQPSNEEIAYVSHLIRRDCRSIPSNNLQSTRLVFWQTFLSAVVVGPISSCSSHLCQEGQGIPTVNLIVRCQKASQARVKASQIGVGLLEFPYQGCSSLLPLCCWEVSRDQISQSPQPRCFAPHSRSHYSFQSLAMQCEGLISYVRENAAGLVQIQFSAPADCAVVKSSP